MTTTTNGPELSDAVRSSPLGRDLSQRQVEVLASLMRLHSYLPHQVLASEGTVDSHLVVVVGGAADVVRHRGTPDETLLVTLRAGDLAHELGFIDGTAHYASLVAAEATQVLRLERGGLEGLIDTDPHLLYAVMCAIVRTVHGIQARLSMQSLELTNYVVKQHGRY